MASLCVLAPALSLLLTNRRFLDAAATVSAPLLFLSRAKKADDVSFYNKLTALLCSSFHRNTFREYNDDLQLSTPVCVVFPKSAYCKTGLNLSLLLSTTMSRDFSYKGELILI